MLDHLAGIGIAGARIAVQLDGASGAPLAKAVEEIKGGVLYHDVGGLWSGFRLEDEPIAIGHAGWSPPSLRRRSATSASLCS